MARIEHGRTAITQTLIQDVLAYVQDHSHRETALHFGIATGTISNIVHGLVVPVEEALSEEEQPPKPRIESDYRADHGSVTVRSLDVKTLADALRVAQVDKTIWEVERHIINSWEVTTKLKVYAKGKRSSDSPQTYTNWQVKVWLRRKQPEVRSLEVLLEKIARHGPIVAPKAKRPAKGKPRRELEISLVDPHFGMHCFKPGADHDWGMDTCERMVLEMTRGLLEAAEVYGPFERIFMPIGNDLMHADNVFHTTTQGTPQPEMEAWQHTYVRAEELLIRQIETIKAVAPVEILTVMGNHDRQSAFTLGRLLRAYYRHDNSVLVNASVDPYKFHHYGVNLIGFEHGHSIHQTVRLAALMANECRDVWGQTVYREWHLGDQHRKGSSKPSVMEEQGVSVEFLPGLTPPNEWHRLKSFNWQKRAGMAFVWDRSAGPIARLQVNVNSYTGKIMGRN